VLALRLRPRPDASRRRAAGRSRPWIWALLAALAVMLSHGLDSETPTAHGPAVAHTAADHHDDWLRAVEPNGGDAAVIPVLSPHEDTEDAGHSSHVCLTGHPPQGPSLSGPLPGPDAAGPPPYLPAFGGAEAHASAVAPGRLAGIQILRV